MPDARDHRTTDKVPDSGAGRQASHDSRRTNQRGRTGRGRAVLRLLASAPRAALALAGSALVTGLVAYYLPKVLNTGAGTKAPLTANVLDQTEPPVRMVVPSARTGTRSPGQNCDSFRA